MLSAFFIVLAAVEAPASCFDQYPYRAPSSARAYFNAFDAHFLEVGRARNLDPALLKSIAYCETRLDPCAVSPVGAQGVMQFMPATFAAVAPGARARDPFDPRDSIQAGGLYVAALTNYWKGDLEAVIASYNAGPTAVARARKRGLKIPNIEETVGYVSCVLQTHAWLRRQNPPPSPEKPSGPFARLESLIQLVIR